MGHAGYRPLVSGSGKRRASTWSARTATRRSPAEPIEGGRAARYLGFKCPHCRLFVPLQRADAGFGRDPDVAS